VKSIMWEFWWYPESFKVFLEVWSRDVGCQRGWQPNPCFGGRSVEVLKFILRAEFCLVTVDVMDVVFFI